MKLRVVARQALTSEIEEFILADPAGKTLPAADAGSHITIETPAGAMRRYSLVHPGNQLSTYTLAIKREPQSRGGSTSMHDSALVGADLQVQAPSSDFVLGAKHGALLIAGGIGVTPIYAMAQSLVQQGRAVRVVYCAREESMAAYAEALRELCGDQLTLHLDHGDADQAFDFWDLLMEPTAEHIYCCGPAPLMEEVKGVTGHWPEGRVHFEEFKPVEVVRPDDHAFHIELKHSNQTITVPSDKTILEALRDHGVRVVSSCESGTCGTCKCAYSSGEVDHRDLVLMADEKASHMMPCVSRAKGERLVLDI